VTALLVALGAAAGATLRYLTGRLVHPAADAKFPWATFVVNLTGSLILGFLLQAVAARHLPDEAYALLGTGFCGALTTYSTFSFEAVRLITGRDHAWAAIYLIASVAGGLGAAFAGITIAQALWP